MTRTLSLLFALCLCSAGVQAQTLDPIWNGPERLSSIDGSVRDRSIALDSDGRSHAFWIEERLFEDAIRLQYARFGGKTWTHTVTVDAPPEAFSGSMSAVDAVIDSSDTIHLIWHGRAGSVFYRSVAVNRALSPSAWSERVVIPVSALQSKLFAEVNGALVIVYSVAGADDRAGMASVRSIDGGKTWSAPVQIDADVPAGWKIQNMDAAYNGAGVLHAVWTYVSPNGYEVRSIEYSRSLDGGLTWAPPTVVEEATPPDNQYVIRLAVPEVKALGPNAYIIYAGGGPNAVSRRQTSSTDSGTTWSQPKTVWAGLEGAAGTDSAFFDSHGRLHLMAQVRFPQGIYHAVLENGQWSEPELIYLIAKDAEDVIGPRVHAQWFETTISADDRIVLLIESCAAGCQDNSSWPQNPIMFAMSTIAPPPNPPTFTSVSSATFVGGAALAPAAIAAGFGPGLHDKTVLASESPLPSNLDGVEVEMVDALNEPRLAGLQFVSPQQINYVIPESSAQGWARVRVRRGDELISAGMAMVQRVAPSIYTSNGQGTGAAAATWLSVAKDGTRSSGLTFDPQTGKTIPIPFDPGAADLYLSLYGTGFRAFQRSSAKFGASGAPVLSIGAQGQFEGLDQINVGPLPAQLATGADSNVEITVDDVSANPVTVRLAARQ